MATLDRARSMATRLGMDLFAERLAVPADEWSLRRDGDDWILAAGAESARLRDARGLEYLRTLVTTPHRDVAATALVSGGVTVEATARDTVHDPAAATAYRARLEQLGDEADAADRAGDSTRAHRVEDERQVVLAELRRGTGLWPSSTNSPATST